MECSCINQNIESQSACFFVVWNHPIYAYLINLFSVKINKTKLFSMFIKPLLHVKHNCSMQSVKQHDILWKFPNVTSITSGGLDKTLAVPVIIFVLTAECDQ